MVRDCTRGLSTDRPATANSEAITTSDSSCTSDVPTLGESSQEASSEAAAVMTTALFMAVMALRIAFERL